MRAMVLRRVAPVEAGSAPLELVDLPVPMPGPGQILLRVGACGVCHTELDEIEGRLTPPALPVVVGHQVVGRVERLGSGVSSWAVGQRAGVGWIHSACGTCRRCLDGFENLCDGFRATGRHVNGGYAECMLADARFAYPIPDVFSDIQAAPLLCAGAIGFRSMRLANLPAGGALGLTGFGASAHLVLKMMRHRAPDVRIYVFARSASERAFARELGAVWTGDAADTPPEPLDAVIDTTPVWGSVVEALRVLAPGGRLVINAIRKEDGDKTALLRLDYAAHLWMEKEIKSVANVARQDVTDFLSLAAQMHLDPEVQTYPLVDANRALLDVKQRNIRGAKVLLVE